MTTRRTRKTATAAPVDPALIAPMAALATATPTGRYEIRRAERSLPSITHGGDRYDDLANARAVAAWTQARYGAKHVVTVYDTATRVTMTNG